MSETAKNSPQFTSQDKEAFLQDFTAMTDQTIKDLIANGTLLELEHIIIHHVVSDDAERIEKLAVQAIKDGLFADDPEVYDDAELAEEAEADFSAESLFEGQYYGVDIYFECNLDRELILTQAQQVLALCEKFGCIYDGWGSCIEDGTDTDEEELEFID